MSTYGCNKYFGSSCSGCGDPTYGAPLSTVYMSESASGYVQAESGSSITLHDRNLRKIQI